MSQEQNDAHQSPTAAGQADAAATAAAEGSAAPEALLKVAEAKIQELNDTWLRAKAETENVRKRAQTDVAAAHKFAAEAFAESLLPVRDSLEAALASGDTRLDSLRSGVELTLRQLDAAFDKASVREVSPAGEKFDPNRHQAISMIDADAEPNTVVSVLQKGYLLHDRVLRPALVTVAKPKT
jgi:molecular chaperone GrpE